LNTPAPANASGNLSINIDVSTLINNALYKEFRMLDLHISFFNIGQSQSSESTLLPANYCLGKGVINTASIYFLALRYASTNKLQEQPIIPKQVELYDPLTKKTMGFLTISLQFTIDKVPAAVVASIDQSRGLLDGDAGSTARLELGLKQVFTKADKDNTGTVSAAEVSLLHTASKFNVIISFSC
jgi:hypothetical protein